jgi:cysteine dioxygenase
MKPIQDFVRGLCGIGEGDFTIPRVAAYMAESPVDPDSLAPYLHYTPTHYTRNLIYKCELFELLAICWDVGHASRIHNHQGQNCWMATPIGRLAIQNYEVVRMDKATLSCELREAERVMMDPEHPSFVDPARPVHSVVNLPEFGQQATSLHVYSHPYDHCLVYSLEKGSCCDVPLFYDSEYGKPPAPTTSGRSTP